MCRSVNTKPNLLLRLKNDRSVHHTLVRLQNELVDDVVADLELFTDFGDVQAVFLTKPTNFEGDILQFARRVAWHSRVYRRGFTPYAGVTVHLFASRHEHGASLRITG